MCLPSSKSSSLFCAHVCLTRGLSPAPSLWKPGCLTQSGNYSCPEPCLFRAEPCATINKSSLKCLSRFRQGYSNLDAGLVTPAEKNLGEENDPTSGHGKGKGPLTTQSIMWKGYVGDLAQSWREKNLEFKYQ